MILLLIFILLLLTALCSAVETAFTAAFPAKISKIKSDKKNIDLALSLIKVKNKVISTLLITYSFINTITTTIATGFLISIYGEEKGTIISSILMSLLIIIFAEVIPKAIAIAKAEKIAVSSSNTVRLCMKILSPINNILYFIVQIFCKILKIDLIQNTSATEELRLILHHHHNEGKMESIDKYMLDGVLDIKCIKIEDVMTHRNQIQSLSSKLSINQIIKQVTSIPYTRIPIWENTPENIIGILHTKKLLQTLHNNKFDYSKINIINCLNDPWFIPNTLPAIKQLEAFKNKHSHLAIVIDEYGELRGLITLEDILEKIVGQIYDEYDLAQKPIVIHDNQIIVQGFVSISDLNRELNLELPINQGNTIAGLIINKLGRIPEQGEKFELLNLNIKIRKKVDNKIIAIVIKK